MSALLNHTEQKERKPKEPQEDKLIKNMECATCKKWLECSGKPRSVEKCVNYIER